MSSERRGESMFSGREREESEKDRERENPFLVCSGDGVKQTDRAPLGRERLLTGNLLQSQSLCAWVPELWERGGLCHTINHHNLS